jgi:hypothetical protein
VSPGGAASGPILPEMAVVLPRFPGSVGHAFPGDVSEHDPRITRCTTRAKKKGPTISRKSLSCLAPRDRLDRTS